MQHQTSLIAILVYGFVLAFVLGALANRLRLSPLVGYLVAGIVAGPFTPGFIGDRTLAPQLAEIGVMLLMFGVGLHFSVKDLLAVRKVAVPGALLQLALATLLGWGLARLLGWSTPEGLLFGFSLGTASTVVLMRALEDRRLLDTRRGNIAVGWLVVEDLACVIALVMVPALATATAKADGGAGVIAKALLFTLGKVAAFVAFMMIVGRRVIPWVLERVAATGSRELFTLAVLAIAMGVAFGSSELFGVSFALGAFFAGMLLNESEVSHKAAADSLPLRDAFAVLFFVSIGMLFNPSILIEHPLLVLATLAVIALGNGIGGYLICRVLGQPRRTALTLGVGLAQIGEFSFILAGLALGLKVLRKEAHDLILAAALLSIILNPILFALLDRWQKRHASDPGEQGTPEPLSEVPAGITGHAIVVGYGRVGRELTRLLRDRGIPMVLVESDPDRIRDAREHGLLTVRGNAASAGVLAEAHPETAQLVILAMPQVLEAGEITRRAKAANPRISVLARAHSQGEVDHLLDHGADAAILAERELAHSLIDMVLALPPYRSLRPARGVSA